MITSIFNLIKSKYLCHAFAEVLSDEDPKEKALIESMKKYRVRVVRFINLPFIGTLFLHQISTPGIIISGTKYAITYPLRGSFGVKIFTYDEKIFDAKISKINDKLTVVELQNCNKEDFDPYAVKLSVEENLYTNGQVVHLGRPNLLNPAKIIKHSGRIFVDKQNGIMFSLNFGLTGGGVAPMVPIFDDNNQFVGAYTGVKPFCMLSNRQILYELTSDK